jgi:exosome complex component MTR3
VSWIIWQRKLPFVSVCPQFLFPSVAAAATAHPAAVLRTGVISQASGSAYAEFGTTKVMVGVYGPRQSERREAFADAGRISCDVKLATFATRQRGRLHQTPDERELSAAVQTALEGAVALHTFPKALLDVYCTVLEAGGG